MTLCKDLCKQCDIVKRVCLDAGTFIIYNPDVSSKLKITVVRSDLLCSCRL
jgi:hypothetical protein